VAGVAIGPAVLGAGTRHLPPRRTHAPITNPPQLQPSNPGQTYATVASGGAGVRGGKCRRLSNVFKKVSVHTRMH